MGTCRRCFRLRIIMAEEQSPPWNSEGASIPATWGNTSASLAGAVFVVLLSIHIRRDDISHVL